MTGYPDEDEGPDEVTWPAEKALSACPFCQGAVQFRKALHICDGNTDAIIHAAPTNCGMAQFEDGSIDESIIAKWNTRSVNAVPDLIAALEQIRRYSDENLGPSRSSLLGKIAAIADAAIAKEKK